MTWKSTDGTASHWKYVVDNVLVYRGLAFDDAQAGPSYLSTSRELNQSSANFWASIGPSLVRSQIAWR
jgi:hypothetical protein